METFTFDCQVITPMFLSGADGRTPELRAPSLKGVMRFWWRAAHGNLSLEELKKKEGEIFGDSGEETGKSKVWIRVCKGNVAIGDNVGQEYNIQQNLPGLQYLYYSMFMFRGSERKFLKPGSSFQILLQSYHKNHLEEASKSIFLLSFLGGLGSRSRRGGGNFQILKSSFSEYKSPDIQTLDEMKKFLESTLKPWINPAKTNTYSCLGGARVYLFSPQKNWQKALEYLGAPFREFRREHKGEIFRTPSFGFPVMHRNPKITMGSGQLKNNRVIKFKERRSSPLIFKVIKGASNAFFPVLIWLKGELVPSQDLILDKKNKQRGTPQKPDTQIIQEFLKSLPSNKKEFIL